MVIWMGRSGCRSKVWTGNTACCDLCRQSNSDIVFNGMTYV